VFQPDIRHSRSGGRLNLVLDEFAKVVELLMLPPFREVIVFRPFKA
jgi:hypothetical protein